MSQKNKMAHVLRFDSTLVTSLSFFHYIPFHRPLTPAARSGCGLYSLVVSNIEPCNMVESCNENGEIAKERLETHAYILI